MRNILHIMRFAYFLFRCTCCPDHFDDHIKIPGLQDANLFGLTTILIWRFYQSLELISPCKLYLMEKCDRMLKQMLTGLIIL